MVMKQLVRFFECELTGDKLAIIWDGKQEICVTEDEGWDVYAKQCAEYGRQQLISEVY